MNSAQIVFDIQSYWHTGSGEGYGGDIDASPIRSYGGLPYIPGRTVKGLFRDAVQLLEDARQVPADTTLKLFGAPAESDAHAKAEPSCPGCLAFSNASLGPTFEKWAAAPENKARLVGLFHVLSMTSIDACGVAKEKTLRRIEVAVPMRLTATASLLDDPPNHLNWVDVLASAARLIRSFGSLRHRGLGRVSVTVSLAELT